MPKSILLSVQESILCLGNRLGHMQIRILFEELLARFPNIHSTSNPVRIPSNFLAGISELKVSL